MGTHIKFQVFHVAWHIVSATTSYGPRLLTEEHFPFLVP